jgi:hypothetical protein
MRDDSRSRSRRAGSWLQVAHENGRLAGGRGGSYWLLSAAEGGPRAGAGACLLPAVASCIDTYALSKGHY